MIQLIIGGISVDLKADSSITLNFESNIFEYGKIKGTQTYPFEFPSSLLNQAVFKSPHHHQRKGTAFQHIFENTHLLKDGHLISTGTLELEETSEKSYKAVLKADASTLAIYGKQKIREIIKHEFWYFSDTKLSSLDNYLPLDSPIVFPTIHLGDMTFNNYATNEKYQRDVSGVGGIIPFFKLFFILKLIVRNLGYHFENDISMLELNKLILFNHRELFAQEVPKIENFYIDFGFNLFFDDPDLDLDPIQIEKGTETYLPKKIKISDHIPNVTLSDFLDGLRKIFALSITFNSKTKIVRLKLLKDILNTRNSIDFTRKAESKYRKKKLRYEGFEFSFKTDSHDVRHQNNPKELDESRFKGEKNDFFTMATASEFEDIKFKPYENSYFRVGFYSVDGTAEKNWYPWQYFADAIFPKKVDDGNKKIQTIFSPVAKDTGWVKSLGEKRLRKGEFGRLIIEFDEPVPKGYQNVSFFFKKSNWYPNNKLFLVSEIVGNTVELHKFSYSVSNSYGTSSFELKHRLDEECEVFIQYYFSRLLPIAGLDAYRPKLITSDSSDDRTAEFSPRLLFYHGLQPWMPLTNLAGSPKFPYASPDCINSLGEEIGNLALRWNGENGLYDTLHKPFVKFWKQAEEVHYKMRLTLDDVVNFNPEIKWRIRSMDYFVKKITLPLTHQDVQDAQVVLIRAGESECKNKLVQEILFFCINTLDVIEQHLCINTLDVVEQFLCINTLDVVEQFLCANTLFIEVFYVENDGTFIYRT